VTLFARLAAFLAVGRPQAPSAPPALPPGAIPVVAVGEAPQAPPAALTARDRERLRGVHPDLVRVVDRARRETAFMVIEGLRTQERQRQLVAQGASKTLRSRHLTGHAVDLGPVPLDWNDWPAFRAMAGAVLRAADEEGVAVEWGGNWPTFRDGPHFELKREKYPA